MNRDTTNRAVHLAERILSILEEGSYTATYKYAVLLAILDLCMESTAKGGVPSNSITTRQLAETVIELYWKHTMPFDTEGTQLVLKQNFGQPESQARILRRIGEFRRCHAPDPSATLPRARLHAPVKFDSLVNVIEWKLIEMPLARLQIFGGRLHTFLYTIDWDRKDTEKKHAGALRERVRAYQSGDSSSFDNRLLLSEGVAEDIVLLNGLLRPLIHRRWASMVAHLNKLEESRLESFLFGVDRISLAPVRKPLLEFQKGLCLCDDGIHLTHVH
jgi:hypothetical protein